MPVTSGDDIRALFDAEAIAVVGYSATAGRPAHDTPTCMQRHGCRAVPANPFHDEILGGTAYDSLADVDEDVDLMDVFQPSKEAGGIVDAAIERAADRDDVEVVWLQLGIRDDNATARAEEAGFSLVRDKCFKVKHSRLA